MRRSIFLLVVLLLPLVGVSPVVGEEDPFATPFRALVHADDVGLDRIYESIRKGLEFADLPKVGPDEMAGDPEAALTRLEGAKPDLLFVVGARAAAELGERLVDVPRVYVYTAWNVNGEEFPPRVLPRPPARVVVRVTFAVAISDVIKALWPKRPHGILSWTPKDDAQRGHADALALAAGFDRVERDEDADLLLHVRLGVGEEPAPIDDLVARAKAHQIPLISDDPAHWRGKASILVIPNYKLLGRIAAEAGRQLYREEESLEADAPRRAVHQEAGLTEVWVDLDAAREQGLLDLSVPWLAGVDRLRGGPRRGTR